MEPRDLLYCMTRKTFAAFLRQLGHTSERYIYGTADNGTNVEYEMRIRITSTDKTGMIGPPQYSLPCYLDALFTVLFENRHSFELRSPPQRDALPSVGRGGNSPSGEQLSKHIAESSTSPDGTIQYFELYCKSSYERLGKLQRENPILGTSMGVFVNEMTQMRLRYLQMEKRLTCVYPCMWYQHS